MEVGGGSRGTHVDLDTVSVQEGEGSSSKLSTSTASNASLPPIKTTDGERKREIKERRDTKTVRREESEKKKEEQRKLDEKLKRKEDRRHIREDWKKRRVATKKKEEVKAYDASSSELSSSSDDGDDDVSYHVSKGDKKKKNKDKSSCTNKKKYVAISFNYSCLTNCDRKSFINVPAGKLPHFDGTNFAKWKHLMRAYLIGLHPVLSEIVCSRFEPPEDPEEPTNEELIAVHLNGQASSILLSALDGNEYNRVMNVDVAKQIWDTLHLAHEGVNKVRRVKIDLLMAKLNRFVIIDGDGPQVMFDRLMTLVGKIRGYGCDELDDHKVVEVMLEAYSPRNETITLIRDKKKFE
jgi:hypothetical protein